MKLLVLLLGVVTFAHATDVSGKWIGTSEYVNREGQLRSGPVSMTLKQTGETLQGTVGPSEDRQQDIRNGRVNADKVTFETEDAAGRVVVALIADGNTLSGEAKFHRDYGVITMKLKLKRE